MDAFSNELNQVLVEIFRSVLKVEENMLKSSDKIDLSISELHLLESVAKAGEKGSTISDIAEDLNITLPSVTIAINKVANKGYVQKIRCEKDGRVVYVTLTKMGHKMNAAHQYFHAKMVREITRDLSEDEKNVMLKGITKLNAFFKKKIAAEEN